MEVSTQNSATWATYVFAPLIVLLVFIAHSSASSVLGVKKYITTFRTVLVAVVPTAMSRFSLVAVRQKVGEAVCSCTLWRIQFDWEQWKLVLRRNERKLYQRKLLIALVWYSLYFHPWFLHCFYNEVLRGFSVANVFLLVAILSIKIMVTVPVVEWVDGLCGSFDCLSCDALAGAFKVKESDLGQRVFSRMTVHQIQFLNFAGDSIRVSISLASHVVPTVRHWREVLAREHFLMPSHRWIVIFNEESGEILDDIQQLPSAVIESNGTGIYYALAKRFPDLPPNHSASATSSILRPRPPHEVVRDPVLALRLLELKDFGKSDHMSIKVTLDFDLVDAMTEDAQLVRKHLVGGSSFRSRGGLDAVARAALFCDDQLSRKAVYNYPPLLEYASAAVRDDGEFMRTILWKLGWGRPTGAEWEGVYGAAQWASERLRADYDFMYFASLCDDENYTHASTELRSNRCLLFSLVKDSHSNADATALQMAATAEIRSSWLIRAACWWRKTFHYRQPSWCPDRMRRTRELSDRTLTTMAWMMRSGGAAWVFFVWACMLQFFGVVRSSLNELRTSLKNCSFVRSLMAAFRHRFGPSASADGRWGFRFLLDCRAPNRNEFSIRSPFRNPEPADSGTNGAVVDQNDDDVVTGNISSGNSHSETTIPGGSGVILPLSLVEQERLSLISRFRDAPRLYTDCVPAAFRRDKAVAKAVALAPLGRLSHFRRSSVSDKDNGAFGSDGYWLNNKEIVLDVVRRCGWASEILRADRDIVLASVSKYPNMIQDTHAHGDAVDDDEIALRALGFERRAESRRWQYCFFRVGVDAPLSPRNLAGATFFHPRNIQYISSRLRNDEHLVSTLIRNDPANVMYICATTYDDGHRGFVSLALSGKTDLLAHNWVHPKWRDDADIAMQSVGQDGMTLRHVSDRLRADRTIIQAALKQTVAAWEFVPMELQVDEQFKQWARARGARGRSESTVADGDGSWPWAQTWRERLGCVGNGLSFCFCD